MLAGFDSSCSRYQYTSRLQPVRHRGRHQSCPSCLGSTDDHARHWQGRIVMQLSPVDVAALTPAPMQLQLLNGDIITDRYDLPRDALRPSVFDSAPTMLVCPMPLHLLHAISAL